MLKCIKNNIGNIRRDDDADEARRRAQCRANAQRAIDAAQQAIENAQQRIEECQTQIDNFTNKRTEIQGKRSQAEGLIGDSTKAYNQVDTCIPGMPINNKSVIQDNIKCLQKYTEACTQAEAVCSEQIAEYQRQKQQAQQDKQMAIKEKQLAVREKQNC